MSTTPERSANSPPSAAKISTGTLRTMATTMLESWMSSNMGARWAATQQPVQQGCVEVFHGAAKENDQALDEDEGLGWNIRLLQRQIKAALNQATEQNRRQQDAHG